MEAKYKRGINHTYLILELPVIYEEDYQMKMLQMNQIEGLLPMTGQGLDGKSQYFYEISGKVSLRSIYEKAEMTKEELSEFLLQFLKTVDGIQSYMLETERLLLEPEYIFYEEGRYYFCYLPVNSAELCRGFHVLTEYFVRKINHKDREGVNLAYGLHKETMEENYNLRKIIEGLQKKEEPIKYEMPELIITDLEEEWKQQEKVKHSVMKESSPRWKKRGRDKWGDWV